MMMSSSKSSFDRRGFLCQALCGGAAIGLASHAQPLFAAPTSPKLRAGEGVVDTTPPNGIELAGFHRAAGSERVTTGIRQPTAARALVIRCGTTEIALVSLDIIAVSRSFSQRVQRRASLETGIPRENIHICATHTHSMPTFRFLRQWGKIPDEYLSKTEESTVQAVKLAQHDLAPTELYLGKSRSQGANFNRTSTTWKTDDEFNASSTEEHRWLDTLVQVLRFERGGSKPDLLWYHFSAHPVCYGDSLAGPDWPGGVIERVRQSEGVAPAFFQGHAGDVNPGDGTPWLGNAEETVNGVYAAIRKALAKAEAIPVKEVRSIASSFEAPLDIARLKQDLEKYRQEPTACDSGYWVDAPFAADWFAAAKDWKLNESTHSTPMSAIRLGSIGMLFHSAELYSFYGLAIRHASPFEHTLVVGYTDDLIGYVTDPKAYTEGEYASITVPRILNLPPFATTAGRELATTAKKLLLRASS